MATRTRLALSLVAVALVATATFTVCQNAGCAGCRQECLELCTELNIAEEVAVNTTGNGTASPPPVSFSCSLSEGAVDADCQCNGEALELTACTATEEEESSTEDSGEVNGDMGIETDEDVEADDGDDLELEGRDGDGEAVETDDGEEDGESGDDDASEREDEGLGENGSAEDENGSAEDENGSAENENGSAEDENGSVEDENGSEDVSGVEDNGDEEGSDIPEDEEEATPPVDDAGTEDGDAAGQESEDAQCAARGFPVVVEEGSYVKSHIFTELGKSEVSLVVDHLTKVMGLKSTALIGVKNASTVPFLPTDDELSSVRLALPDKAAALDFLDNDGPAPPRYAVAVVIRGSRQDVMDYLVGPLPFDPEQGPEVMRPLRQDGEIPYSKRPSTSIGTVWQEYAVSQAAIVLQDLLRDMSGGHCYKIPPWGATTTEQEEQSREDCEEDWVDWMPTPAYQNNRTARWTVIYWYFAPKQQGGTEMDLHPLPLSFKLDESAMDFTQWRTFDFEYCHQGPFDSAEELAEAHANGSLPNCSASEWSSPSYDFTWALTDKPRPPMPDADIPGPRLYEPQGHRHKILGAWYMNGNRFRWMHWEGHVTLHHDTGIAVYDVTWRGQRILYQLALQEQLVTYSGFSGAGQALFVDSAFKLGRSSAPLKRGLDCPETAVYFSAEKQYGINSFFDDDDVICMFEDELGTPSWRHLQPVGSDGSPGIHGVRGTALVLRSVATIGNYDYIYDIIFHLDASIEVKVTMAGYMVTAFHDPSGATFRDRPFGTRVYEKSFALLHDHLSNWKVDLDVHGRNNSFYKHIVRSGTYEQIFRREADRPGWFQGGLPVKYIEEQRPTVETTANVNVSEPSVWTVVNENVTNSWGQVSGYAVVPGLVTPQLLGDQHPITKAAAWTKYHIAITKQRDSEPFSSYASFDFYNPGYPVTSLDNFLDGDNIQGEDLVAWVTSGVQHIPRSEDLPLIQNFGTSFYLKPWNYFDELQSMMPADTNDFDPQCTPLVGSQYTYSSAWD